MVESPTRTCDLCYEPAANAAPGDDPEFPLCAECVEFMLELMARLKAKGEGGSDSKTP